MNKKLRSAAMLLCLALGATAQNLTITIPKTDSTAYKCYPVKANTGFSLRSQIACNANGPFSVKIDRDMSFGTLGNWVGIANDNTPITISTGQMAIFDLAVQPPAGTPDYQYDMPVNIKAYKNGSSVSGFAPAQFVVIVDNTPPTGITLAKHAASGSQSVTLTFDATDAMSKVYSDVNPNVGRKGIKQFSIVLKDQGGVTRATATCSGTESSWVKTVSGSGILPGTTYTAYVTATDLAGNPATSEGMSVITAPAAPTGLTVNNVTYFGATLEWNSMPGATNYEVYNGTTMVGTTSSTQFRVVGLQPGSTSLFGIKSVSSAGKSGLSNTISITTLSPGIIGDSHLCSTGSEYTVENLLPDASITWSSSTNIIRVSEQGANPSTFISGSDFTSDRGTITATVSTTEGQVTRSVSVGLGMRVDIAGSWLVYLGNPGSWTANTLCGVEPFSYQWYYAAPGEPERMAFGNSSSVRLSVRTASDVQKRYHLRVEASDAAGNSISSSNFYVQVYGELSAFIQEPIPLYSVSPNPSSSEITVSLHSDASESTRSFSVEEEEKLRINSIKVFNQWGRLVISESFFESQNARVNVGSLRTGIYIVLINDQEKHTLIKE